MISYSYSGSSYTFYYIADYSKLMNLTAVDANAEEPYQSSGITTLDFKVNTSLSLTGLTPTLVAYFPVGTSDNVAYGDIKTFGVTWDATNNISKVGKTNFDTLKGNSYCFHLYFPTIGFTGCARFKITPPLITSLNITNLTSASFSSGGNVTISNSTLALGTLFVEGVPATDATDI